MFMNRCRIHRSESWICEAYTSRCSHDRFYRIGSLRCFSSCSLGDRTWISNNAWYGSTMAGDLWLFLHCRSLTLVCAIHRKSWPRLLIFSLVSSSANRIPERFAPGNFDFFFASHQIFHFFVVFAALAHYKSILLSLDFAYTRSQCGL